MTREPNNSDTSTTPVDMAVNNAEVAVSRPYEPAAPLVLKAGGNRLPDIKRADQMLGDHAPQIPPEIVVV